MTTDELNKLKEEFLKNNKIKYLDYWGNEYDQPRPKRNTFQPQGILTIYHPGIKEEVL